MSIPNPAAGQVPSHAGHAPSPAGYQHAGGAPMPVVRQKRPPLPPAHRRAALRAGAFGNALVGLGVLLIWTGVGTLLVGLTMQLSVLMASLDDEMSASDVAEAAVVVERMWQIIASPLCIVLMIASVLLGAAVIVLGIMLSNRILRRAGVRRAAGVTWSGAGIVRGISWFLSSIFEQPALLLAFLPLVIAAGEMLAVIEPADARVIDSAFSVALAIMIATAVLLVLVSVAVQAGIGMLLTWWMAHAFRGWGAPATDASTGDPSTAHRESAAAAPASSTAPPPD